MKSGQSMTNEQQMRMRLSELVRALEQIEAIVSVATAALRHQNCERDADVAQVLQRDVNDRISVEREKTGALLASLKPKSGRAQRRK